MKNRPSPDAGAVEVEKDSEHVLIDIAGVRDACSAGTPSYVAAKRRLPTGNKLVNDTCFRLQNQI